jgi:hypothetical protein
MLDIYWVTGMDTGYLYPQKNIRGYLIISITVPADTKFHHTHIQWIIIRCYLLISVPIATPNYTTLIPNSARASPSTISF